MQVSPIKTTRVEAHQDLWQFLDRSITSFSEKSVLVVTSKVVSLCEGSVVAKGPQSQLKEQKQQLSQQEAQWFLPPHSSKYHITISIVHDTFLMWSGIDESNAGPGWFVLTPKDPYATAQAIWEYLRARFGVKECGVIISDSKAFPLRWGSIGTSLGHCGFKSLHDYRGTKDLFDREMIMTYVNVSDGVAAAAVLCMGETNESQPLCMVSDIPHIEFQDRPPSPEERAEILVAKEDDAFEPMITAVEWSKGGRS